MPAASLSDQTMPPRAVWWRLLALAVFVILVCARLPPVVQDGRFWAEEGKVFYFRAWTLPWWQALWLPWPGYLNLVANLAGLAARYLVRLQDAPRVTAAIALVVQALPAVLLVSARDEWLRRPTVLFAAILIVAMPVACNEIWLNTATSQFHVALGAALCLALAVPAGTGRVWRCALLLLAPLCSPASVALAPLFFARAVMDRSRARAVEAACIVAGTVLQLAVFHSSAVRHVHVPGPATLASIFAVKHLATPLLGQREGDLIADILHGDVVAGHYPIAAMLTVGIASCLLLTAVVWRRRPEPAWLLAGGLAIACLSYYGALEGGVGLISVLTGERYAFAPCMLFALAVLALAATGTDWIAQAARTIVIWLLVIATQQTVFRQEGIYLDGPRWTDEVRRWRVDPTRPLAIWPAGWSVVLPPHPG